MTVRSWFAASLLILFPALAHAQSRGSGPELVDPAAITAAAGGAVIYVADSGDMTVKAIETDSGDRQVVVNLSAYPGGFEDIDYAAARNELVLLTRRSYLLVISLDDSEVREIPYRSTDPLRGERGTIWTGTDITVSADGRYAYRIDRIERTEFAPEIVYNGLFEIDLATGAKRQVRRQPDPSDLAWIEPDFGGVSAIDFNASQMFMAPDHSLHVVHGWAPVWNTYVIDPVTARQEMLLHGYDAGRMLRRVSAIIEDGTYLYFADAAVQSVSRVRLDDPDPENIAIFSGRENRAMGEPVGEGPDFVIPADLALLGEGGLGVLDTHHKALFAVDTDTGARRLISGQIRPYTPERELLDENINQSLCRVPHMSNMQELRQRLTLMNWDLNEAYPEIRCAIDGTNVPEGASNIDDIEFIVAGYVDLMKDAVSTPGGVQFPVRMARYYIREREEPEKIAELYNTVHSVPRFASGTLLDFLRFHRDNPNWTELDREKYDRAERLIRRFGGLTQAELEAP